MKRKVKFQEGGSVDETPSRKRVRLAEEARTRGLELRDLAAREDRRVGLAERARQREQARREAARRQAAERSAAQREVARFNERMNRAMPVTPDEARRLGAEPAQRPANPRPNIAARAAGAAGAVARGASRAIPGLNVLRELTPTSLEAGAEFERAGMAQAREEALMQDRAGMEQEMGEAAQRMPTPRPRRAARPAPRRAEMSADRLNELMMGAEPMNAEERLAQMRMQGRRQELEDRGTAFKKGGMIKKKAGGMIAAKPKAAPKKMMKGGAVAKPKGKPMPFKKGGVIKKGRK